MSEEFIPSLTLDPNPTAAAVQEAPVEEEKVEAKEEAPVEKVELNSLSPAEQAAVRNFAEQIDVTNTEQILNYGRQHRRISPSSPTLRSRPCAPKISARRAVCSATSWSSCRV